MSVTILLKDDNVIVAEMSDKKQVKKMHQYKLINLQDDDGMIAQPYAAAEFVLQRLKQDKVKMKKVGICIDRRGVVAMNLTIPVTKKKLIGQMVRLAVEEKYPGSLNTSYMTFKVFASIEGEFHVSILLVSKKIANSYVEFAKGLKAKITFIESYPNIVAKTFRNVTQYPEDILAAETVQTLAIAMHQKEFQILVLNNYNIMQSTTVALPLTYTNNVDNRIKVDKIYQGVNQMLASIGAEENLEIYLDADQYLSAEDIKELDKMIYSEHNVRISDISKNYSNMLREFFIAGNERTRNEYEEFNLKGELQIKDPNNFLGVNKLLFRGSIVLGALSVGALGLYMFHEYLIEQHETVISERETFIEKNAYIDELIKEKDALAEKLEFSALVDNYAHESRINFEEVEESLHNLYKKYNGNIETIEFPSSLNYTITGRVKNFRDVANIMNELEYIEDMLYSGVVLTNVTQIQPLDETSPEEIEFTVQGKYNLYSKLANELNK